MAMSLAGLRATVWKGKPVLLKLSDDSESGFLNVCKGRTNSKGTTYYAKFVPEGEKAQRTLPGSSFKKPEDAAAELAYFLAGHRGQLGPKEARATRRDAEVWLPLCSHRHPLCFAPSVLMCLWRRTLPWHKPKQSELKLKKRKPAEPT